LRADYSDEMAKKSTHANGHSKNTDVTAVLREFALHSTNSFPDRLRAIDLLAELGNDGFAALSEIATKGNTLIERMNAMDKLEQIVRASK
jgi:hypothetical protein